MKSEKCSNCKKQHNLFFKIKTPKPRIGNIDLDTLEKFDIFYIHNDFLFFPAILTFKVKDFDEELNIHLWIKVSKKEYEQKFKASSNSDLMQLDGEVIGIIPFYKVQDNLKVKILFNLNYYSEFPPISLNNTNDELYKDYTQGIPSQKYCKWMYQLKHNNLADII